ncbi:protein CHLOROPLAST J-LIKE DOMAIN 1, chloroplastic-like isoform X3 [Phaseolus vulgaris]|uniref:protein CHLOROPLAST J-LIKE DOMAIN 1, chloroplastic-like isoform X3 n=1 Tax=Phaseolus vulgaris TaxID=3885 RepID=UPI0035CA916B
MALGISNILHCPKLSFSHNNLCPKISTSLRFTQTTTWSDRKIICVAASVTGSFNSDGDFNPYEVLGVSHIEKFDMVKATNRKKGVTILRKCW